MKRIIYTVLALVLCLALSCKKEVINVADFGKVVIDSISPGSAPSGSYIVVYGKNFAYLPQDVKVKINQLEGQVVEASPSRMLIFLPEGATTGLLQFNFDRKNPTNEQFDYSGQMQSGTEWPGFTIDNSLVAMPIIRNVQPRNGKAGDVITITGYNFSPNANLSVLFGDAAGEVTSINGNELKVKVPVTTPATVNLKVQQGNHNIGAGTFVVDETPKGVNGIYFTQSGNLNQICRVTFDAQGNPAIQVLYDGADGVNSPDYGIKADPVNEKLYWIDGTNIWKGSTDGSLPPVVIYTDPYFIVDLDLDVVAGKLYFTSWSSSTGDNQSIKRINTDGSGGAEEIYVIPGFPLLSALKLNVATGKIYWTEGITATVNEGSMNGEAVQPAKVLFDASDGLTGISGLAISPSTGKIFILDLGNAPGFYSGALDGSGTLSQLPIPAVELGYPGDVEIDDANQFVYWLSADYENSRIMRCKTDGTNVQRLVPGINRGAFIDLVF